MLPVDARPRGVFPRLKTEPSVISRHKIWEARIMPRLGIRHPIFRKHKQSGQAIVDWIPCSTALSTQRVRNSSRRGRLAWLRGQV